MKAVSSPSQQEVCPFCKKPFKRLKTHLPHCKLAKVDKKNGTDVVGTKIIAAESQLTGKKTKQKKNMLECEKKNKSKIGKTGELGQLLLEDSGPSTSPNGLSKINKRKKPTFKQQQQVSLTTEKDQRRHLRPHQELSSDSSIPHSGILSIFGTKESLSSEKECLEKDQKPHPIMKVKLSKEAEVENHSAIPAELPAGILKNVDTKCNGTGNTGVQHKGCAWSTPTDLRHQIHDPADVTTLSKLPHSIESTTEWSKVESLATGKKEVWDHIKHSLARMNLDEQEQSASAAFHLPTSCVPCGTLALENAKFLRATSTLDSIQNTVINHDIIRSIQPLERNRQLFKNSSGSVLQQQATLTRRVGPACSLGLQWFPELYPNYISLRLILGRQNHGNIEWNTNKIHAPKKAHHEIPLALRNLMDVRMKELPTWIVNHFSIKSLPGAVQKAWGQYYSKYINVKKGGMGGLTMLLAGYCILSYTWNYDHIKQDRWRRYH